MPITSQRLALAASAVVLYAVVLLSVWALRPLDDAVPVGIDWTPTIATPPTAQRLVSIDVECNTLFASTPRGDEPLPELTPQPDGRPPLEFQREPCALVQADARRNLALNSVFVFGALGAIGYLALRQRRAAERESVGSA